MYTLGIDLGTTFTAAAVCRDDRAEVVSLGTRAAAIPSVVLIRNDGAVLTGEAANRRALTEPQRVAREFKRRVGDSTPILLGGVPYSPEALTARLLTAVVEQVASLEGGPAAAICVCHPANWGPYKIDVLEQAIRLADPQVPVGFSTEPEAAAIFYARQQRLETGATVAVYDLGGGTFDAAVLSKTPAGFEILGRPEGIDRLGGIDIDAAVFGHVTAALGGALEALDETDPAVTTAVGRLREECTQAKEALSSDIDVSIPVLLPHLTRDVRLTRAELEAMVAPALQDSIDALKRALRAAAVTPDRLDAVLLVGGSSRMPIVARLVAAELGRPVAVDAHPKHAVSLGAAWLAAERQRRAAAGTRPDTGATRVDREPPAAGPLAELTGPRNTPDGTFVPALVAIVDQSASPTLPVTADVTDLPPTPPSGLPPATPPTGALAAQYVLHPAAAKYAGPHAPEPSPVPTGAGGGGHGWFPSGSVDGVEALGPPEPIRVKEGGRRRPGLLAAGAAVAVVLVGGGTAYALHGPAGAHSATANELPAASVPASPTAPAVPAYELCTTAMKSNPRWACLTRATFDGTTLTVYYDANWDGVTPTTVGGYHLHVFGSDGTSPDPSTMHTDVPGYFADAQDPVVRTVGSKDYKGGIHGAPIVCGRIADSHHDLVPDAQGGFDTGNCVPIELITPPTGAPTVTPTGSPTATPSHKPTHHRPKPTKSRTPTPTGTGTRTSTPSPSTSG